MFPALGGGSCWGSFCLIVLFSRFFFGGGGSDDEDFVGAFVSFNEGDGRGWIQRFAGNASPEGCSIQNEPRGNKHNMLNITTLEGYVM